MFEQVYRYKWFGDELKKGPLSPYLDGMAKLFFERDHSRKKVRQYFVVLGQLSRWMVRHQLNVRQLNEETVNRFLRLESRRVYSLTERGDIVSVRLFVAMLEARQIIVAPISKNNPAELILTDFEKFLRSEKGMSSSAIFCYKRYSSIFLEDIFGTGKICWHKISCDDIYQFVLQKSKFYSPGTNKLIITALRSFFQFLKMRGKIAHDLSASIPSTPNWKTINLPYFLSQKELEKLLRSIDRSTVIGKRDFAIILLLARLGLRACEVASLTMNSLDWSNGEVLLSGKGVRQKRLPIAKEVGSAVVEYLKIRKRNVKSRKVFLRSFPPYDGVTSKLIGASVRAAITRAKLKPLKSGSHLLRHTSATQMLKKGASLTEIGMILGHQSVQSTSVYAKVDLTKLLTVSRPWPLHSSNGGMR